MGFEFKYPKVVGIFIVSSLWIIVSISQWGYKYPDLSQLTFALMFGLVGFYVAYDQWFKTKQDVRYDEVIQMCDNFLNWKLKQEEKDD